MSKEQMLLEDALAMRVNTDPDKDDDVGCGFFASLEDAAACAAVLYPIMLPCYPRFSIFMDSANGAKTWHWGGAAWVEARA